MEIRLEELGLRNRKMEDSKMGIGIFIDGGYLTKLNQGLCKAEGEQLIQIDFSKLILWLAESEPLHRAYYYDCLPYQPPNPSFQDRERVSKRQKFFDYLKRLPRLTVKTGLLAFRGYYQTASRSLNKRE